MPLPPGKEHWCLLGPAWSSDFFNKGSYSAHCRLICVVSLQMNRERSGITPLVQLLRRTSAHLDKDPLPPGFPKVHSDAIEPNIPTQFGDKPSHYFYSQWIINRYKLHISSFPSGGVGSCNCVLFACLPCAAQCCAGWTCRGCWEWRSLI